MAEIKLHKWAATALLGEAREWFDSAADELMRGDESQHPTVDAYTEIIGRLAGSVARWPQEDIPFEGVAEMQDCAFIEVEFSTKTLDWLKSHRDQQRVFIGDLDDGEAASTDPGYMEKQVYLLHVLDGIVKQREGVAA